MVYDLSSMKIIPVLLKSGSFSSKLKSPGSEPSLFLIEKIISALRKSGLIVFNKTRIRTI